MSYEQELCMKLQDFPEATAPFNQICIMIYLCHLMHQQNWYSQCCDVIRTRHLQNVPQSQDHGVSGVDFI